MTPPSPPSLPVKETLGKYKSRYEFGPNQGLSTTNSGLWEASLGVRSQAQTRDRIRSHAQVWMGMGAWCATSQPNKTRGETLLDQCW